MSDEKKKKDKKKSSIGQSKSKFTIATTSTTSGGTDELCPQALTKKGYSIGKQLNSGQYGVIYEAKCVTMPDKKLVCKRCSLKDVSDEWVEKCLKIEMKVMMKLHHENIVRCHELFKTRHAAFIFMDYIEKGNIQEFMTREKKALTEKQTKLWFGDITSALCYTHGLKIAHRDLKLENFMINCDDKAILTDFGFACLSIDPKQVLLKGTRAGTADYMAPEIRGLKAGKVYDPMVSDMYSMGVCLFEMLHKLLPFGSGTTSDPNSKSTSLILYRQNNRKYDINPSLSSAAKDLINKLLDPQTNTRITAQNTANHDFLKIKVNK